MNVNDIQIFHIINFDISWNCVWICHLSRTDLSWSLKISRSQENPRLSRISAPLASSECLRLTRHANRLDAWGWREDVVRMSCPSCRLRTWLIVRFQQLALLGQLSLTVIKWPYGNRGTTASKNHWKIVWFICLYYDIMRYSIFRIPTFSSFFYRKKNRFGLHLSSFTDLQCQLLLSLACHLRSTCECYKTTCLAEKVILSVSCHCLFAMPLFGKKIPTSKADLVSVNLANVCCSCLSSKSANFCARSLTSILEWAGDMAIDWVFLDLRFCEVTNDAKETVAWTPLNAADRSPSVGYNQNNMRHQK